MPLQLFQRFDLKEWFVSTNSMIFLVTKNFVCREHIDRIEMRDVNIKSLFLPSKSLMIWSRNI